MRPESEVPWKCNFLGFGPSSVSFGLWFVGLGPCRLELTPDIQYHEAYEEGCRGVALSAHKFHWGGARPEGPLCVHWRGWVKLSWLRSWVTGWEMTLRLNCWIWFRLQTHYLCNDASCWFLIFSNRLAVLANQRLQRSGLTVPWTTPPRSETRTRIMWRICPIGVSSMVWATDGLKVVKTINEGNLGEVRTHLSVREKLTEVAKEFSELCRVPWLWKIVALTTKGSSDRFRG